MAAMGREPSSKPGTKRMICTDRVDRHAGGSAAVATAAEPSAPGAQPLHALWAYSRDAGAGVLDFRGHADQEPVGLVVKICR